MTTSRHGEADPLWLAVADPTRQALLEALLRRGAATATVLAAESPITRQGVVKHLEVLERAGLVVRRRTGREVSFAVRPEALREAARQMSQLAEQWSARLDKAKDLAEALHRAHQPPTS